MIQTTETGKFTELTATEGCIHKKGTDIYVPRILMLPGETVDMYEEAGMPAYAKPEYDAKVAELVRGRYSADEEFAIQRKAISAMLHPEAMTLEEDGDMQLPAAIREYNDYNDYVESCKERAKDPGLYGDTE